MDQVTDGHVRVAERLLIENALLEPPIDVGLDVVAGPRVLRELAALGLDRLFRDILAGDPLRGEPGDLNREVADELLELLGAGDEVRLAIDLDEDADAALEGAAERAQRAIEPEPELAAPEPDYEEGGASDALVAALAGGAALSFEPDLDEEEELLPGARAARAEAAVAEPAEASPDEIAAELAREAAEQAEEAEATP